MGDWHQHGPFAELNKRALGTETITEAAGTLVGTYTDKLNSVNTSGVIRQATYMISASAGGLLFYFLLLRPNLAGQLAPKTKVGKRIDKYVSEHFEQFSYVTKVWKAVKEFHQKMLHPEDEHLIESGLDQIAYLRLLWMSFCIFACISITTSPILVYKDWKAHHQKAAASAANIAKTQLNDLTIQGLDGTELFWHLAAGYINTIAVFCIIWWNTYCLSKLRVRFYTHPGFLDLDQDMYKRCVMIADVGHNLDKITQRIEEKVRAIDGLKHVDFSIRVFDPTSPESRAARMERRNEIVLQLERAITNHLESGGSPHKEPMIKPYVPPNFFRYLAYELISIPRPGALAFAAARVPALTYFKQQLLEAWFSAPMAGGRHRYAFIAFPAAGHVSIFVKNQESKAGRLHFSGWEVDTAPEPNGIIWPNIRMNPQLRAGKYLLGYATLCLLLVAYCPPLAFIALLSNVGAVTSYFPTLETFSETKPTLFLALTTILPPIMSATLFSILPKIIHGVAYAQGSKNVRSLQLRTIHWYLAFMIIAQLFMFPSLSTLFTLLTNRVDKEYGQAKGLVKAWVGFVYFLTQIPMTYQRQANYWLNWLALRWFLAVFQLAQGPILAKQLFTKVYRHLTAREKEEFEAVPAEYAIQIPQALFIVALGLLYSPLVPFVPIFASVALLALYIVHKVQACLLYRTVSETGARFWLPEMDRILLILLLSQGMLGLTCGLQSSSMQKGLLMAPASIATVLCHFGLRARFNATLLYVLDDMALHKTSLRPNINRIDLGQVFGFDPKGVRMVFKDEIKGRAVEMLNKYGLGELVDVKYDYDVDSEDRIEEGMNNEMSKVVEKQVAQHSHGPLPKYTIQDEASGLTASHLFPNGHFNLASTYGASYLPGQVYPFGFPYPGSFMYDAAITAKEYAKGNLPNHDNLAASTSVNNDLSTPTLVRTLRRIPLQQSGFSEPGVTNTNLPRGRQQMAMHSNPSHPSHGAAQLPRGLTKQPHVGMQESGTEQPSSPKNVSGTEGVALKSRNVAKKAVRRLTRSKSTKK